MLPIITERPNAPWPGNRADTFNMKRHHIVPYNMLRDTWNCLVRAFTETQLPEARTAIRQFLGVCNHRLPNVDTLLDRMRANQLTVPECNLLMETAVWSAWNIVEGPGTRSDDPGDDGLDRFTFGITMEEFRRMRVIDDLFESLQRFLAAPPANAVALRTLINDLIVPRATFTFVDVPIPFRPEMWELEYGFWHKRRSGEQFLVVGAVR